MIITFPSGEGRVQKTADGKQTDKEKSVSEKTPKEF